MVPRCLRNATLLGMAKSNQIVGVLDHSPRGRVSGKRAERSLSGRDSRCVDTAKNWPGGGRNNGEQEAQRHGGGEVDEERAW
jgi:hypothetical protein